MIDELHFLSSLSSVRMIRERYFIKVRSFIVFDLWISNFLIRFASQAPYLIHEHTKTPHITGCGVFLEENCL